MNRESDTILNVLWTGGWDSTFRICYLLFETDAVVQPWYLVDESRMSTAFERTAMDSIRAMITARVANATRRLLPTRVVYHDTLDPDPVTSAALGEIRKDNHLGYQYEYLARMARQYDVHDLELGSEALISGNRFYKIMGDNLETITTPYGTIRCIVDHPDRPSLILFRDFRYPLLSVTKPMMKEHAWQQGYLDIMKKTWFCHTPVDARPCGMCQPCQQAMLQGSAWRMPLRAQLVYYLYTNRVLQLLYRKSGLRSLLQRDGRPLFRFS